MKIIEESKEREEFKNKNFEEEFKNKNFEFVSHLIRNLNTYKGLEKYKFYSSWYDYYENCDITVSLRKHGSIIRFLSEKEILKLSFHGSHKELKVLNKAYSEIFKEIIESYEELYKINKNFIEVII